MIYIEHGEFSYPRENFVGRSIKSAILKQQDSKKITPVFSDLCLEVNQGDVLGLHGRNGSGKTTLLKLLEGVLCFNAGEVVLPSNTASFIDINMGIETNYTGYEALLARCYMFGLNRTEAKKCANEAAKMTQLSHNTLSQYVKSYSTGMQMRLGFSVAMSINFECILLDEWLSVGDEEYQKYSSEILKEKIDRTPIVVIASHNQHLLDNICTKLLCLDELQ